MTTGLWLSLAKNYKIFISAGLGFVLVKNGLREFLCLTDQITKINELISWSMQILGVLWYLECPASYERAEQIDSSEPKVVRGMLIYKPEGLELPLDGKKLDNFPGVCIILINGNRLGFVILDIFPSLPQTLPKYKVEYYLNHQSFRKNVQELVARLTYVTWVLYPYRKTEGERGKT